MDIFSSYIIKTNINFISHLEVPSHLTLEITIATLALKAGVGNVLLPPLNFTKVEERVAERK